jgi:protein-S-isoprenylcysteine O-methyltransferase Ste14
VISPGLHHATVAAMFALAVVTFLALLFMTAPYGRHHRAGWGPVMKPRVGWMVMESPSVVVFGLLFALGPHRAEIVPCVFLGMWQLHYVHRAFVYPLSLPRDAKPMPALVVASGFTFNLLNSVVNAGWIGHVGVYATSWLSDPRFLVGVAIFIAGGAMNRRADRLLRALRAPGESGYKIPRGGMYEWVSCPNYLGEIIEWSGWALATWSEAGFAFAVYTVANLAPRAWSHHVWYRAQFPEYPRARKALIPFVL